jgi:hypothetical protein
MTKYRIYIHKEVEGFFDIELEKGDNLGDKSREIAWDEDVDTNPDIVWDDTEISLCHAENLDTGEEIYGLSHYYEGEPKLYL